MSRFAVVTLCAALAASSASATAPWWALEQTSFAGIAGERIPANVVTVDARRARLKIFQVGADIGAFHSIGSSSLREFSLGLQKANKHYRTSEWISANGGFSSYRTDVPLGLLVIDAKVYSKISLEKTKTPGLQNTPGSSYRWSGILCQEAADGPWKIIGVEQYMPGRCTQALQAGPLLVADPGIVAISAQEPINRPAYTRTAFCLGSNGRLRFIHAAAPTHLLPFARWLAAPEKKGGLGCATALNLSGDDSAGLAFHAPRSPGLRYLGAGNFPLPTVLVVEPLAR